MYRKILTFLVVCLSVSMLNGMTTKWITNKGKTLFYKESSRDKFNAKYKGRKIVGSFRFLEKNGNMVRGYNVQNKTLVIYKIFCNTKLKGNKQIFNKKLRVKGVYSGFTVSTLGSKAKLINFDFGVGHTIKLTYKDVIHVNILAAKVY